MLFPPLRRALFTQSHGRRHSARHIADRLFPAAERISGIRIPRRIGQRMKPPRLLTEKFVCLPRQHTHDERSSSRRAQGSPRDCSRVRQHSARSQRKQYARHHPPPGHLPHASEETAQRQRDRHAQRKSLQSQRHARHQPHHAARAHTQIHRCRHRHQPRRRHAKVYIRQHHPRAAAQEHQQQIPNRQSAFKRLETSSAADALYRAAHDRRGERSQQNGADAKEQRRRRPLPHADDCPRQQRQARRNQRERTVSLPKHMRREQHQHRADEQLPARRQSPEHPHQKRRRDAQ